MSETWRPVPEYPGYEVSNRGRVLSHQRKPSRLLTVQVDNGGYFRVGALHESGKRKLPLIHRLVAAAFIGPRPEGMECRHLNGDKNDNRPENLRWGTHSENVQDTIRHGRHNFTNRTHCPHGHPYDEVNTLWRSGPTGGRLCRTCNREHYRRWYQRRIEQAANVPSAAS